MDSGVGGHMKMVSIRKTMVWDGRTDAQTWSKLAHPNIGTFGAIITPPPLIEGVLGGGWVFETKPVLSPPPLVTFFVRGGLENKGGGGVIIHLFPLIVLVPLSDVYRIGCFRSVGFF